MAVRYVGPGYPVRRTSSGFPHRETGIELIKDDIVQLLKTEPGDRVGRPRFGTRLRHLLFEQGSSGAGVGGETVSSKAENAIREALRAFEPRVDISKMDVVMSDGVVSIALEFILREDQSQTIPLIVTRTT